MKKKLISIAAAIGMILSLIPSAAAVNYANYVGSYSTGNSDGTGFAALDIITCTESSITLDFYRIKNDNVAFTYTFTPGTVTGDKAVVPFTAKITSSGAVFSGKLDLVFQNNGMIKIAITSSQGSDIYNGTLPKVNSSKIPNASAPAAPVSPVVQPARATAAPAVSSDVRVELNDNEVTFSKGFGPFIENDRTYVPLRSVFYEMGINVYWDEYRANDILNGQQITCTKDGMIVQFTRTRNDSGANRWTMKKWVDSDTSKGASESFDIIDQQPKIVNDTAYLPLRVLSEAFGAHVNWVGSTKTVDISCSTSNTCWYDRATISAMEKFTLADAQSYVTDDYSNVVADPTPYYVPEAKFYLFSATDMYGAVKLRIYYGGYIDVVPDTDNATAYTDAAPVDVVAPAEETAPAEEATPAEEVAPTEEVAPPAEDGDDEPEVFTFDMTKLLNGDSADDTATDDTTADDTDKE